MTVSKRHNEDFRDRVIKALQLEPEDKSSRDERYAMTTNEFIRSIQEEAKTRKGNWYFPSYELARVVAESYGLGRNYDRIIYYTLGWAIQRERSGPYLGPKGWV